MSSIVKEASTMDEYEKLLRRSAIAVALGLVNVVVCYFWIDRPVAFFVHYHHLNEITSFSARSPLLIELK